MPGLKSPVTTARGQTIRPPLHLIDFVIEAGEGVSRQGRGRARGRNSVGHRLRDPGGEGVREDDGERDKETDRETERQRERDRERERESGCKSSGTEVRHEVGKGLRAENGWEKGDDVGGAAGTEARGSKLP